MGRSSANRPGMWITPLTMSGTSAEDDDEEEANPAPMFTLQNNTGELLNVFIY